MNIVNVGYDSTNYYVLATATHQLLIDVGMPDTLPKLERQFKTKGLALSGITYLLCTHYHPDHAGLAQVVKHSGVKLIVVEGQQAAVPLLEHYTKPSQRFQPIDLRDVVGLSLAQSRVFLAKLGIAGEITSTKGHSDDSISLVLDNGTAFTGDLEFAYDDQTPKGQQTAQSWHALRALGVRQVYPGHGPIRVL